MTDLGATIATLRDERGWSRARLAAESDLSYAFVRQLETGERKTPRAASLQKIAAALGVSIDDLYRGAPLRAPEESVNERGRTVEDIHRIVDDLSDDGLAIARDFLVSLRKSTSLTRH